MSESLKILASRAVAQAGVTRRRAADAQRLIRESAARRAALARREKTVERFVELEFREAAQKRQRDPRMRRGGNQP